MIRNLNYDYNISEFRIEISPAIGDYTIVGYAIHDYYPTRFTQVDEDIEKVRKLIYDFRKGKNSVLIAEKIAKAIIVNNFNLSNACLCIIPTGSSIYTRIRFSQFCKVVSDTIGIQK